MSDKRPSYWYPVAAGVLSGTAMGLIVFGRWIALIGMVLWVFTSMWVVLYRMVYLPRAVRAYSPEISIVNPQSRSRRLITGAFSGLLLAGVLCLAFEVVVPIIDRFDKLHADDLKAKCAVALALFII